MFSRKGVRWGSVSEGENENILDYGSLDHL